MLSFSFLGVMAALIAKSYQTLAPSNSFVILPMTFLYGTSFSIPSVPTFFQCTSYSFPLTHSSMCIRASALGWTFPWESLDVLIVFGLHLILLMCILLKLKDLNRTSKWKQTVIFKWKKNISGILSERSVAGYHLTLPRLELGFESRRSHLSISFLYD